MLLRPLLNGLEKIERQPIKNLLLNITKSKKHMIKYNLFLKVTPMFKSLKLTFQKIINSNIFLLVLLLGCQQVKCQNSLITSETRPYKFQVRSISREELPLNVFYYTSSNKEIRYTSGFSYVSAYVGWKEDTIKTVAVWATGYFLRIMKINFNLKKARDTLFLDRLMNDSVYKLEGLIADTKNILDVYKSTVALKNYSKFMTKELKYKFVLLAHQNNLLAIKEAEFFFKELLKINPALKIKLTIEQTANPRLKNGVYIKALRQKK